MSDLVVLYRRAVEQFGSRVEAIADHQWHLPTPNTDWDVHALVNHLVYEELWSQPLLDGQTVAEVGTRFDGDLLGHRPKAAWEAAARGTIDAAVVPGVLTRTVHVSFGDISGEEYLSQLTTDHVIHTWDLARATGGNEGLDPELVEFTFEALVPQIEQWREVGVFGPRVEPPAHADRQTQLLALTGRAV